MIRANGGEFLDVRLDAIEAALTSAESDRIRVEGALERLDPERATAELKSALRANPTRPGEPEDPTITTLRRRHEAVNGLMDRRDELERRVDATVADLEALAAQSFDLGVTNRADATIEDELARLHQDLTALEQAHDEVRDL